MKELWEKFTSETETFSSQLTELSENVVDIRLKKGVIKMVDGFNKMVSLINEIDKQIEPISPVMVKMPFPGEEFQNTWILYKEYMIESHKVFIMTRQESVILKKVFNLSGKDEKRAIDMLEFFIQNGYRSIFRPSDKQLYGEEPPTVEVSSMNFNSKPTV
jgi:hypothetical protein